MKAWFSKQWVRFKGWVYGILIALGLVAGGIAMAVPVGFSWTNPTQNTDGSAFDAATEQAETRLYCGVDPAGFVAERPGVPQTAATTAVITGAATSLTVDFMPGSYTCFATVLDVYGYESDPSNTVTKTVDRFPPSPPVLEP